jgi:hypothetical protein
VSFGRNSQQPNDHWEFALARDAYRQGTPVRDVEKWVKQCIAKYRASEMRRFHTDWEKFKLDTLTEATRVRKEERAKAKGTGAVPIYLMPLVPILFEDIDTQIEKDLPTGWDPDLTRTKILEALQFIDNKSLTPNETKAFHLVHVICIGRTQAAADMGITKDGLKTHLCNAWKKIAHACASTEKEKENNQHKELEWFLCGGSRK